MLGVATVSKLVAPAIVESGDNILAGIASRSLLKAERAAKEFGAERAFESYDKILDSDEVDVVYIPLPNSMHAEWTIKAAQKGKHVLCEKPLALNSEEALQMINACEENDVLLMEAFMYRHHPQHAVVKDIISSGRIGDVVAVNSCLSTFSERTDDNRWRGGNMGGGALMDLGCYCVDVSRLLLETEPTAARATWKFDNAHDVDVTNFGILKFADDMFASFMCSMLASASNRYEVVGTKGRIKVPVAFDVGVVGEWPDVSRIAENTIVRLSSEKEDIVVPAVDQYKLEVEHFSRCVHEGKVLPPAENGYANMLAMDMIRNACLHI